MLQITWFLVMVVIYQTVGLPLLLCKNENGTTVNETSMCTAATSTIIFTFAKPEMAPTGNPNTTLENVHNFDQNAHHVGLKAQDCNNCSVHNNSNPGVQMRIHGSTTENAISVGTTNNSSLNQGKETKNNPYGVQMGLHDSATENAISLSTTKNSSINQDKEINGQMAVHGSTTENAIGVNTTNNNEIKNNPDDSALFEEGIPATTETYTTEEPIFLQRWKTFRMTSAINNEDIIFPSASEQLTSTATIDENKLTENNYPVLNDSLLYENGPSRILPGNEENITSDELEYESFEFEPEQPCKAQIGTQPISFPEGTAKIPEEPKQYKIGNTTVTFKELLDALSNKTAHDNALKMIHKILDLPAPNRSYLYENDDSESELFGNVNVELTTVEMIKEELEYSKHTDLGEIVFNPEVFVPREDEYDEVSDDSKIITNLNTSALNDTALFINEYPEYSYEDDE